MLRLTTLGCARLGVGRLLRRGARETSGLATAEFALVTPILALLLVGVIDYSLVFVRQMALANAVRAGVQYATIRRPIQGDTSAVRQAVLDAAPAAKIGTHDPQVTLFCECPNGTTVANCDPGACGGTDILTFIDITLSESFPLLLSYPGFDNPVALSQRVTMRLN